MTPHPTRASSGTRKGDIVLWTAGIVLLVAVAVFAPLDPGITHKFERVLGPTTGSLDLDEPAYTRQTVSFSSRDTRIEAWLYLPKDDEFYPPPIVVMAHGLGGQRDFGLHPYAHEFAMGGLAVLVFDYRGWGGSDGEPRHWVSPLRHIEDWVSAIDWVVRTNANGQVNSSRLALWGTSFSGGHVLVTAARLRTGPPIAAIVSQVPHLSGKASSKNGLQKRGVLGSMRLVAAALHDGFRSLSVRAAPGYVKLAGKQGDLAFMLLTDFELERYYAKHPKEKLGGWQNLALARLAIEMPGYSPIDFLPMVQPPVLFVAATQDSLCPLELVRQAATSMGSRASLHEYNTTHFDLYVSDKFALSVGRQVAFFRKHFGMPPLSVPAPKATDAAAV